jgi:hypothetical protein
MKNSPQKPGERLSTELIVALGVVGLAFAALTLRRPRVHERGQKADERRASWITYLREHLAGADAAIEILEELRNTHEATAEGTLFDSLHRQILEDRSVVTALLAQLGASPRSIKRLGARSIAKALKPSARGKRGELTLFRTLEALSIGVQGKRCLWRAAQAISPPLRSPVLRDFVELESRAVAQWEAIERYRQSLASSTFGIS